MLVARGKMQKTPCKCGATEGLEARQRGDYSDPWDVEWQCRACRRDRIATAA